MNVNEKQLIIFLIALVLALLGNCFPYYLFFGVDLTFGSIMLCLIADLFGWTFGLIGASIAGGYTLFNWVHPYGAIIEILQFISVKYLLERRNLRIVLSDFVFWIFLGMPCMAVFYLYFLHMDSLHSTVIVLKDAVNGIFNALIASLLSTYFPFYRWFPKHKRMLSISQVAFHLMTTLVILPSLLTIIVEGRDAVANQEDQIEQTLTNQSNRLSQAVVDWIWKNQMPVIRLADVAEVEWNNPTQIQRDTELTLSSFPDFYSMGIMDQSGTILSTKDSFHEGSSVQVGDNFSFRPFFKQSKETQLLKISGIFTGVGKRELPTVAISVPIIQDNQFQGLSVGVINPHSLKQLLSENIISNGMILSLVDSQNQVIASTNPHLITMEILNWRKDGEIKEVKKGVYQWKPLNVRNPMQKWGISVYTMEVPIEHNSDWKLVVQLPLNTYQNHIYSTYSTLFFISLVSTFIVLLSSLLVRAFIRRPLSRLAKESHDLPKKVGSKGTVQWVDSPFSEFQLLISNFREMGNTLQDMFTRLNGANKKLDHLAYYDPLTGLPNQLHFTEELDTRIQRAQKQGSAISLMFLDLDRFKLINDTLGHTVGDTFLQQVAERLSSTIGSHHFVARLGGDEFILLLYRGSPSDHRCFCQTILFGKTRAHHDSSIGISLFPKDARDADMLIQQADTAMYSVKESGKNGYLFFHSSMNEKVKRKVELERKLRKAISEEQLEVYYQPKINAESGEIVGVEALCRWYDPNEGWISPAEFISLAEENILIRTLGQWVLEKASTQAKECHTKELIVPVSVNLSVEQLRHNDLVRTVSHILDKTDLDPKYLELEITENLSLHGVEEILPRLYEHKKLGVKISMDDFGTGYSSLSYFQKYPIDTVKIDQSFVRNYEEKAPIIDAILDLAHRLGLEVIAEGVETGEQRDFLIDRGCKLMHGYYFSRPLPAMGFEDFLKRTMDHLLVGMH